MAMVVECRREEEIAMKKKAESSGDLPSWLRRRKALECSGTGWLLRAASPVKIPRALQRADPKLSVGFRWAGDLAAEKAGSTVTSLFTVASDNPAPLPAATDPRAG